MVFTASTRVTMTTEGITIMTNKIGIQQQHDDALARTTSTTSSIHTRKITRRTPAIHNFSIMTMPMTLKKIFKNQNIQTAAILTCGTLFLLGIVTITTHSMGLSSTAGVLDYYDTRMYHSSAIDRRTTSSTSGDQKASDSSTNFPNVRFLQQDQQDQQENNNDYREYTCDDIFQYTEPNTAERCLFAQTCNSSQGLFASFVFCSFLSLSTTTWCILLSPFLLLWLILLFAMLGSTAEDFFSPSLEMFSVKMGLPPRFAGVTLLALGNGAADVSATMSAIELNPSKGYQMSLGALTGAGMFVGTVVAGIVMVLADGVRCRGALVRDLCMFMITCMVVHEVFKSGRVGQVQVRLFLGLYLSFVLVVLLADVYHRKVVLPRMRRDEEEQQRQQQQQQRVQFQLQSSQLGGQGGAETVDGVVGDGLSPMSGGIELASARTSSTIATEAFQTPLTSEEMEELEGGNDLALDSVPAQPKRNILRRGIDRIMMAMSNYGPNEGTLDADDQTESGWGGGLEVNRDKDDEYVRLHGTHGLLARHGGSREESQSQMLDGENGSDNNNNRPGQHWLEYGPATSYRALMEGVDQMCTNSDAVMGGATSMSWRQAISTGWVELKDHFHDYYNDIWENDENSKVDKFLLTCELPFTALRKLSVAIPCEDYYCRGLLAASVFLTPAWLGFYAMFAHDANLFIFGGFPYVEIWTLFTLLIALFILKLAPADESHLSLKVSVPLAFLGFIVAATWIDVIADQLVKLLTFLGVIFRIPGSIMGLTVLAWGNSMGDLSANMTMAKKGLANMAITACFAGPVFNILVGLGGGFWKLNASTGQEWAEVDLTPSIRVGLLFLVANCLLVLVSGLLVNRGHIPKGYGYVALTLYGIYVCTSIGLQYRQL